MAITLRVPNFSWTSKFYADFRQAIRRAGRVNVPELTEESDSDPYMQLESAISVVGHLLSATVDFVARHLYLPTSLRWQAVDCILRSMGLQLDPASPATVEIVAALTRRFSATQSALVPARSRFSTLPGEGMPSISFESASTDISTVRNDQLLAYGYDSSAASFVAWIAGIAPWAAPTTAGDTIYVGHADLMIDGFDADLATASYDTTAIWEYCGHKESAPDAVSWGSPSLTLTLTALLGSASRLGALVTVFCVPSRQSQTVASTFSGGTNRAVVGALGQVIPSTSASDYVVSVEWIDLPGIAGANDGLDSITADGIAWTLPQTASHRWTRTTINGILAYWIRWRVISVGGAPIRPVLGASAVSPGASPKHYILISATQGETITELLGTSSGAALQAFALGRSPFIGGSVSLVLIGTDSWVVTEDPVEFYSADPTAWICLLDRLSDGTYQLLFGDGSDHGAIPTAAAEVRATYRIGAADNGNVGSSTVTRNSSGVAYLTAVTNPRAASGWSVAEGSTEEDLERVKRTKPAALRAGNRIVTAGDAAALVIDSFEMIDGSRPVSRAWGVEEAYGPKTIGLTVVGGEGALVSAAALQEIDGWANGVDGTNDPTRLLTANVELTAKNYTPRAIDGTIIVTVRSSSSGVEDQVREILADLFRPLKERQSGSFLWSPGGGTYGGRISPTFVAGEVFSQITVQEVLDSIVTVLEGVPAVTVLLGADELPTIGTWVVSVVVV